MGEMKAEKSNMEKGCNVKGLDNERVLEDIHFWEFTIFSRHFNMLQKKKKDQTV